MKHFRHFATIALFAIIAISNVQAQPKKESNWQEKMMSEKIGFITTELELTPEEAQVFWPVYNQIAKKSKELHKNAMAAYLAMSKALEEGTASEKEINKLLDNYLAAKLAHQEFGKDNAEKYRKVLPGHKVAKLYIAEDNFKRNHLRNMKAQHGHKEQNCRHKPCPRPQANK